jgi:tetrathionate reductase subunit B
MGAASLAGCSAPTARRDGTPAWAMVVDVKRCIGCHACTISCKAEQGAPLGRFKSWVIERESGAYPDVRREFVRVLCNQCDEPPCVDDCPTAATYKRPDAMVEVDPALCIGCGICVDGCPYGMRYLDERTRKAAKCDFCIHRVERGLAPACITTCNGGALVFGDLSDPESKVSRLLKEHPDHKTLMPALGTGPRVFYLGLEATGVEPAGTDPASMGKRA